MNMNKRMHLYVFVCVCVWQWLAKYVSSVRTLQQLYDYWNQVTLLNTRNTTRSVADLQFTRIVIMINAQHR